MVTNVQKLFLKVYSKAKFKKKSKDELQKLKATAIRKCVNATQSTGPEFNFPN